MTEQLSNKNPCNSCGADRQIGNPNRWECECDRCSKPYEWKNDCIKKLAEYETAEEEGRLVVLPCKPGQVVYVLLDNGALKDAIIPCRVRKMKKVDSSGMRLGLVSENNVMGHLKWYSIKEIGKTVFLTYEKAKKALREGKRI